MFPPAQVQRRELLQLQPCYTPVSMCNKLSSQISLDLFSKVSNGSILLQNWYQLALHIHQLLGQRMPQPNKKSPKRLASEKHDGHIKRLKASNMGVSENRGTPKMDGLYWKTQLKWMIWGYPIFGNIQGFSKDQNSNIGAMISPRYWDSRISRKWPEWCSWNQEGTGD